MKASFSKWNRTGKNTTGKCKPSQSRWKLLERYHFSLCDISSISSWLRRTPFWKGSGSWSVRQRRSSKPELARTGHLISETLLHRETRTYVLLTCTPQLGLIGIKISVCVEENSNECQRRKWNFLNHQKIPWHSYWFPDFKEVMKKVRDLIEDVITCLSWIWLNGSHMGQGLASEERVSCLWHCLAPQWRLCCPLSMNFSFRTICSYWKRERWRCARCRIYLGCCPFCRWRQQTCLDSSLWHMQLLPSEPEQNASSPPPCSSAARGHW